MRNNALYMAIGIDAGPPVMEQGSFCVRTWPGHKQWNSIITHDCNGHEPNWIAPLEGTPHPCPDCGEGVPDEVMAAWILHNFDEIQSHPESGKIRAW